MGGYASAAVLPPQSTAEETLRDGRRTGAHLQGFPTCGRRNSSTRAQDPAAEKGSAFSSFFSRGREDFKVKLVKSQGDVLGAGLGNTDKGAVIFNIQEHGLLSEWNHCHPNRAMHTGYIITSVNGITGYWDILEALQRPGVLALEVSTTPPDNAGPGWFEEITEMSKKLQAQGTKSSFMLRLQPKDQDQQQMFSSLPTVRAGDCGIDQCAICIDDVDPDDMLTQLPCGHGFHSLCAARWLTQGGKHAQGKRQCCPLCCRKVVSTGDGGVSTSENQ